MRAGCSARAVRWERAQLRAGLVDQRDAEAGCDGESSMSWFANRKISTKMVSVLLVLTALSAGVGILALTRMALISDKLNRVKTQSVANLGNVNAMSIAMANLQQGTGEWVYGALVSKTPQDIAGGTQLLRKSEADAGAAFDRSRALADSSA